MRKIGKMEKVLGLFLEVTNEEATNLYAAATVVMRQRGLLGKKPQTSRRGTKKPATQTEAQ